MKKILGLFSILVLPAVVFAAAGDIKIDIKNASNNAWISTILAKQNNSLLGTDSNGVPTFLSGLTWSSPTLTGPDGLTVTSAGTTNVSSGGTSPLYLKATSGGIRMPSTVTGGFQFFNTANEAADFEKLEFVWSGNFGHVRTSAAGSGVSRPLVLSALDEGFGNNITIRQGGSASGGVSFSNVATSGATPNWVFLGTNTATSGTVRSFSIGTTYNQSAASTSNVTFSINETRTSRGSGDQLVMETTVANTRRWGLSTETVSTADATPTTVATVNVPASTTMGVSGYVVARRTGGSSGTAEDGAMYRVETVYKNAAGTATNIGTTITVIGESQAAWDVTVSQSSDNILIQVTGAANNNITWSWVGARTPIST